MLPLGPLWASHLELWQRACTDREALQQAPGSGLVVMTLLRTDHKVGLDRCRENLNSMIPEARACSKEMGRAYSGFVATSCRRFLILTPAAFGAGAFGLAVATAALDLPLTGLVEAGTTSAALIYIQMQGLA